MTAILFPGVAQAKLNGVINSTPWNCIWHFSTNTSQQWTVAQLNTLGESIRSNWGSHLATQMCSNVVLNNVATVDIGTNTPNEGASASTSVPGSAAGVTEPTNVCYCVIFNIQARYRGGKPRTYLPGGPAGFIGTNGQWAAGPLQAVTTGMAALITAVVAALSSGGLPGVTHVTPRYTYNYVPDPAHHKYLHQRTGPNGSPTVSSYSTQPRVCTQNRRLGATVG